MTRNLFLLSTGAVIGAVVFLLVAASPHDVESGADDAPTLLTQIVQRVTGQDWSSAAPSTVLTGRDHLEAYRAAAAESDPDALQTLIERAARGSVTALDHLQIEAWLSRLGEFDPARAAILSHRLNLQRQTVVQAFQSWAEVDGDRALVELDRIEHAGLRRAVAVGLMATFGDDAGGIRRVTSALPTMDRVSFQIEAVERLAETDPNQALRVALDILDGNPRGRSIQRIATAAAMLDPRAAIVQSALLPDDLRSQYHRALSTEWARLDMEGYLAYLDDSRNLSQDLFGGLTLLLASDPERAFELAERLPGQAASQVRLSAMITMAQRDPLPILDRVDGMPPGPEREQLIQAVAGGYARLDPEAAITWVRQLEPPSQSAQMAVWMALASSDPDRAVDLMLESASVSGGAGQNVDIMMMTSVVASQLGSDPARAAMFADRLLESDADTGRRALSNLMSNWARRDEDAAFQWMLDNADRVDASLIGNVAGAYARNDVAAAVARVDQVPLSMRAAWITQVAGVYAGYDLDGALNWVAGYQGQDGYSTALRQIISRAAQDDPRMAGQVLVQAPADVQRGATSQVASSWARQDPSAAASWAQNLADSQLRTQAVAAVVSQWGASQPEVAKRWALALPGGALRDQAVESLIVAAAASGQVDRSLFDALSSDQSRDNTLQRLVPLLARQNQDEARQLVGAYVTDPRMRSMLEERIDAAAAMSSPSPSPSVTVTSSGGIIISR